MGEVFIERIEPGDDPSEISIPPGYEQHGEWVRGHEDYGSIRGAHLAPSPTGHRPGRARTQGAKPAFLASRYAVTNLDGETKELYERVYCQRGEKENRLKEQQLDLFADRTSCTRWWANQYRVLLAALAYTLLETMRHTALRGTDLARAQCQTLRLRLLKIGAVVTRNTRTITVRLSSACPDQAFFRLLVHRLTAG